MEQRLSDEGVSEIMKRQGSLGGYLVPPECVLGGPIVIDIQDAPAVWFPILNNGVCDRIELSPREESLLREAPVFRTSQLEEPQPDVIVKPKEPQC